MKQKDVAAMAWVLNIHRWITHTLLLVPEAALITALLCAYMLLGQIPSIGIVISILIVGFIARTLALMGARRAFEAAHLHEAEALVNVALALYPWSADGLTLRGSIALINGYADQAEHAFQRSLALWPNQPAVYAALSCALLELNRPLEAANAAQAALALAPDCAIAHLYLAEAAQRFGAPTHTIEDQLRAGLAIVGTPAAEAALRCALGAHLLAEERIAEATLTLHGAEALVPSCTPQRQITLRVQLGELMIAQGQIERAREHFRTVAALDTSGRYTGAAWRASHLL